MPAERLKNTATITEHNIYWERPWVGLVHRREASWYQEFVLHPL
ncbi:uncharacterized protein METZ01_LOCUS427877, partial [marine metagenome]